MGFERVKQRDVCKRPARIVEFDVENVVSFPKADRTKSIKINDLQSKLIKYSNSRSF